MFPSMFVGMTNGFGNPSLNRQIARTYLAATGSEAATRGRCRWTR